MPENFLNHLRVFPEGKKERGEEMPKTVDGQTLNPRFLADTPEGAQEVPGVDGSVGLRGKDEISPRPVRPQGELFLKSPLPQGLELFHHLRKQGNGAPPLLVFWFLHDESPVQGGEALGDGDCPLL